MDFDLRWTDERWDFLRALILYDGGNIAYEHGVLASFESLGWNGMGMDRPRPKSINGIMNEEFSLELFYLASKQ
jgi:hypothetical protein